MARFWFNFEFHRQLEELENQREHRLRTKNVRDHSNPFLLPEMQFKKLFRLPKVLVQNLIEELRTLIQPAQRSTGIPLLFKVLITLNFVGQGCYQTTVGEDLNLAVSQPVVSRVIAEITNIIGNQLLERYVVFPAYEEHINQVKHGFKTKFNFPNVIGVIDCTHVAIIAPTDNDRNPTINYWCRKGFYSINVQAICDSDLLIVAINARYPGATHDSAIWAMSRIYQHLRTHFEAGIRNKWLLGDAGYNLQPWLITPINDAPENSPEGRFTSRHCSARNAIERCFGVLKQRFRCLLKHRVLHYNHARSSNIIYTCAVLHNLCVKNIIFEDDGDTDESDTDDDIEDSSETEVVDNQENAGNNWLAEGQRIRRRIINRFEMDL